MFQLAAAVSPPQIAALEERIEKYNHRYAKRKLTLHECVGEHLYIF